MGKTIEGLLLKFQTEKLNLMGLPNVADRLPQRLFYFRLDSNILKKIGVRTFSISIKLMKMASFSFCTKKPVSAQAAKLDSLLISSHSQ